jgi:hypothetical protein
VPNRGKEAGQLLDRGWSCRLRDQNPETTMVESVPRFPLILVLVLVMMIVRGASRRMERAGGSRRSTSGRVASNVLSA